jgi:hypothetical protein
MFLAHIPPKTVTIRIPKGYQMDAAASGVERVACTILEHLRQKLSDAEIDYESFDGVHNFLIRHDRTRFRGQFTDQALLRKSPAEISNVDGSGKLSENFSDRSRRHDGIHHFGWTWSRYGGKPPLHTVVICSAETYYREEVGPAGHGEQVFVCRLPPIHRVSC